MCTLLFFTSHGEHTDPHFSHLMVNTQTASTSFHTLWQECTPWFSRLVKNTVTAAIIFHLMVCVLILIFHTSWSIHWPLPLSSIPHGEYTGPHFSHLMVNTLTTAAVFYTSWWVHRSSFFTPHGQYTDRCHCLLYLMVSTEILTFHTSWSIHWVLLVSSILHGEYTDPNFSPLTHTDRCHCLPYLTVSAQILTDRCCYGPYYSSDITIVVDWA